MWVPRGHPRRRPVLALGASLVAATTLALCGTAAQAAPTPAPTMTPAPGTPAEPLTEPLTRPPPEPTTAPPLTDRQPTAQAGWTIVWSDEFNGRAINRAVWNVLDNASYGDGNEELACLMDRAENVSVAGGVLTIAARKEARPMVCGRDDYRFPNGRLYTSGMVTTKNKLNFEYGRFEIRAKTPLTPGTSKGLWPAFWMRPARGGIGELDILEAIGTGAGDASQANRVVQTIHYDYVPTYAQEGTFYDMPAGNTADGFHDYAVEWEPGTIKWFVDGVQTYERNSSTTSWLDEAFVNKFFMRLNLAVGGTWPGSPDADTAFPAKYQIDYVRVYQRYPRAFDLRSDTVWAATALGSRLRVPSLAGSRR